MNKDQFTNFLQNTENLNADTVGELTDIVSRFPYCQSVHILLTLNLFKEENVLYNAQLKTAAIYAANRSLLKQKIDQLEKQSLQAEDAELVQVLPQPTVTTVVEEEKEVSSTPSTKSKQELLDKFIKNQPSISRGKQTFFNATDASRRSIVDQEDIVSETLAKIYFDQHYIDKAINIYEKLSLKYPEKSIYFAALIEKAKKELKS